MEKYGHFTEDGLEFVINQPNLPRPWSHFLTNEEYCSFITHTGGGFSFFRDCATDRMLRWSGARWQFDRPGRYIFLRDKENGEYWSINWQPLRKNYEKFETRHGLGYTVVSSKSNGIEGRIEYFVPVKELCELWKVKIKNDTNRPRHILAYPYLEWLIGDSGSDLLVGNISNLLTRVDFDKKLDCIKARKTTAWRLYKAKPYEYEICFATNIPVKGYDCNKSVFLGRFNDETNPETVINGSINNSISDGEKAVGVLQLELDLAPFEEKEFVVILGHVKKGKIKLLLDRYRNLENVNREFKTTKNWWLKMTESIRIKTPDPDFNIMMNYWIKYQIHVCNYWSRSPGLYHEGQGGRGYRDSCQDAEGMLAINPDYSRKKILAIARLIRKDGTNAPGWSDTYGPYHEKPFKDHPTWFVSTVNAYVKETGDKAILNKKVSYLKDMWRKGGMEIDLAWKKGSIAEGEGTIFEHIVKQLNYTFNDCALKGFPRIGYADWNDAIDSAGLKGKGSSVWLGQALVRSMKLAIELAEFLNKKNIAADFRKKVKIMTDRLNRNAWDGEWFVRGFKDNGKVFGSNKNKEGKIFLNTQSWAILSDTVEGKRKEKMLKSMDRYLDSEHGMVLFAPHYATYDFELGRIALFSPGTKENAAIFCHAATFKAFADCMAGRGTKAYQTMRKIMPNVQKDYDLYKTEPYTYAEYLVGPGHPYLFGEGAFTWVTGTAGWTFLTAIEGLLGVKRDFKGLRIDPCIPSNWKECKVIRKFRGSTYAVEIKNPKGVEKGVKEVTVDGKRINGNLVKAFKDGKTHKINVIMG